MSKLKQQKGPGTETPSAKARQIKQTNNHKNKKMAEKLVFKSNMKKIHAVLKGIQ